MADLENLEKKINVLRKQMVQFYEEVGELGNKDLIALSQQLDVYLLQFQQCSPSRKPPSK